MNNLKKVGLAVTIIVLTFLLLSPAPSNAEQVGPRITLKLSHQWPQDPHDYVIVTAIRFAEMVEKRSGGSIHIDFYPAESLCKAREQFRAMRNGTLDMSIFPVIYAAGEIPELQITHAPWWPRDHDHFFHLKSSEVWNLLEKRMNEKGVKSLSWIQIAGGIASKKKPIREPGDLAGLKVRTSGKAEEWLIEACGAGLVSMASSEVYSAMQRGTVDAVQTSSSSFAAFNMWDVSDYYLSPEKYCTYFTTEPIQISLATWKKLTPEQQQIMIKVGQELEPFALDGAKAEDARVSKLFAYKCKVSVLTQENNDKFRALGREQVVPKFIKSVPNGEWMVKVVDSIQ